MAYHPAGGIVRTRIFSITCTTCRARLAIRSESAIGAILECPQCQSMVQVEPPSDWKPAAPSVVAPPVPAQTEIVPSAVPPPLDRVATGPLTLELEPSGIALFYRLWGLWSAGALVGVAVIFVLLWLVFPRSTSEPEALESVAVETERPATAGAEVAGDRGVNPPGTQSGGVANKPATRSPVPKEPTLTQPPRTPDLKAIQVDPFPAILNAKADDAPRVEVKKVQPTPVNVPARLADPIAELELNDVPLSKAADMLAAMGSLPVTIDADALCQLGIAPGGPISLHLRSATLGQALQAVAAQRGLAASVDGGHVFITAPAEYREMLRTVRYMVADLTGNDRTSATDSTPHAPREAELATLVLKLVAPESWKPAGGRGTISLDRGSLVIEQTGEVHQQVLVFCEKLRIARRKPLRSRENPALFTLATRRDQARDTLERPVTANFHQPTPISKVLVFLAKATKSDILVDRAALAAAGTSDRVEVGVVVNQQPLATALDELLRPLGLTYRVVGPDMIQVTTHEALEERLELEFYPIGSWLANHNSSRPLGEGPGVRASALIDHLKARISPSTWSDVGGSAEVHFDPPSQCLIVLQSQPVQTTIEGLLADDGGERRK
jgi:hypothetical protein